MIEGKDVEDRLWGRQGRVVGLGSKVHFWLLLTVGRLTRFFSIESLLPFLPFDHNNDDYDVGSLWGSRYNVIING